MDDIRTLSTRHCTTETINMKNLNFLLTLLLTAFSLTAVGQTREIVGKVVCSNFPSKDNSTEHEFWNASGAVIFGNDSIRLGVANDNGDFNIKVPQNVKAISIGWIGMYPEQFVLLDSCEFLEVILLPDVIYDFVTLKKAERLREKDRKVLPELYIKAVEQGILKQEKPCR